MIWVAWRQFRAQALAGLAVLAAVVIYLLVTGLSMHHSYTADLATCAPQNNCDNVLRQFQHTYNNAYNLLQLLVIVAPGLIGIFWGAPLIARELETGTHQLAWNQSITRTRWLAAKLAGVGAASIAAAALLGYLLTWWSAPLDQVTGNRFSAQTFVTHDIVPLGYAASFFVLGTTTGLLLRRTLPAMALTIAVFIGIQILVPTVMRPNLLPSTTVTFPVDHATAAQAQGIYTSDGGAEVDLAGLPVPQGSWVLNTSPMQTSSGQVVHAWDHQNCFPGFGASAPAHKGGAVDMNQITDCLAQYDLHQSITYQPASHYWPLQWIETGIFTALAAALSGFCFWWIRRRQN